MKESSYRTPRKPGKTRASTKPGAVQAKIFVDINSKQVKVTKVHVAALGYQFGYLEEDDARSMMIVEKLNSDQDSPLQDRVKIFDEQKGTWITNVKLAEFLRPHVTSGGKLHGHNPAQQAKIFKEFFGGAAKNWPSAWGHKRHRLSAPLGIEILLNIFPDLKHRCDLYHGGQYTTDTFAEVMKPLVDAEIKLPGGPFVVLTWESGDIQVFGNQAMRNLLVKRLRDVLTEDDNMRTSKT